MNHDNRGFWCEFCKDYHATIECPHPAKDEFVDKDEARSYQEEANELEDRVHELEGEIEGMVFAIEELIKQHFDAKPELLSGLEEVIA